MSKHFIYHAASLRQAFAHCGIFSTAASRRSMGRVSVPSVGVRLSPPLRVIALVSRYLTNKLMRSRSLPKRKTLLRRVYRELAHLSMSCARLRGKSLPVTTSFATGSEDPIQLACPIHAASVHPELGSNSEKITVGAREKCYPLAPI